MQVPLIQFHYSGTQLCVPADAAFRAWLAGIQHHEGTGEECVQTERDILEAFYHATSGGGWDENDNWLTDAPLDEWHGVRTDEDGNVTGLDLYDNLLVGRIPPEFGQLAHLERLQLARNFLLDGPLPPEFFDLARLRTLSLWSTDIGGPLSPEIGRLADLQHLNMSFAGVTGPLPPELGNLTNLESLEMGSNYMSGPIPPELGKLTNLWFLNLYYNELEGQIPPELGRLSSLSELYLGRNHLVGEIPAELGDLENLTRLYLDHNALSGDIPPSLGNLSSLLYLQLQGNGLSGVIPASLGDLDGLWQLRVDGNALAGGLPNELGEMAELEHLWVGGNERAGGRGADCPRQVDEPEHLQGGRHGPLRASGRGPSRVVARRPLPAPAALRTGGRVPDSDGAVPRASGPAGGWPAGAAEGVRCVCSGCGDGDAGGPGHLLRGRCRSAYGTDRERVRRPFRPTSTKALSTTRPTPTFRPDVIQAGLEVVIDVDPGSTLDASLGIQRRIPATGRMAIDVVELPDFPLTLIPFLYEPDPDNAILGITEGMAADPESHPMLAPTRDFLPVGGWDIELHDPVLTSTTNGFLIRNETELMRRMEGARPGYWLSMQTPIRLGLLGVAYGIPSWTSFSQALPTTVAHEIGHNMGLWHAPCGGAGGPDPLYPHPWGVIGSWGYDRENRRLVSPHTPDLMSYCGSQWISEYHYANALRHRMDTEEAAGDWNTTRALLVWGGVDAGGDPYLEPSFIADALPGLPPAGNDYVLSATTEDGREAFSYRFDMPVTLDVDDERSGFVYAIPVTWAGEISRIRLSGADESFVLDGDTDLPMTILRDPVSGQIRAILRRPVAQAMDAVGEPSFEVLFSRGIPE